MLRDVGWVQLTLAKIRELMREPEALFWVFVFPLLLSLALGIAFRQQVPTTMAVGVQAGAGADRVLEQLAGSTRLRGIALTAEQARESLRSGKVALVVIPGDGGTYWFDPTRPDSRLARLEVDDLLQRGAGRRDPLEPAERQMTERGSRYIDFLIPGLLGMNLMGTGMWGIGFSLVNARSRGWLKRLVATPMRRSDYLLAQILGRLIFLIPEVVVLVLFATWVFDVPLRGGWLRLGAVAVLGAMTFSGLGLLVASRSRTLEGVSGLMNFVMLPMWIFSGTFFSTSRFPDFMQPAIQALPLTAVNDALRAVMIDGAGWGDIAGEAAIAAIWSVVAFGLALRLFRWH